jgi:hypothetical protein
MGSGQAADWFSKRSNVDWRRAAVWPLTASISRTKFRSDDANFAAGEINFLLAAECQGSGSFRVLVRVTANPILITAFDPRGDSQKRVRLTAGQKAAETDSWSQELPLFVFMAREAALPLPAIELPDNLGKARTQVRLVADLVPGKKTDFAERLLHRLRRSSRRLCNTSVRRYQFWLHESNPALSGTVHVLRILRGNRPSEVTKIKFGALTVTFNL